MKGRSFRSKFRYAALEFSGLVGKHKKVKGLRNGNTDSVDF